VKLGVVMNPLAGGGRAAAAWPEIARLIEARLGPFELRRTTRGGEAAVLAHELAQSGAGLVIAAGGDGTMSEVADGLLRGGTGAEFGFIPLGTGVDFARTFGVKSPRDGVEAIASGRRRKIDAGKVSYIADDGLPATRHFVNVASLGLSGPTVRAVNKARLRGGKGRFVFLYHTLTQLLGYRWQPVRVRLDGEDEIDADIALVAVCNARFFGGGLMVAPDAAVDDGLFEVVIVKGESRLELISVLNSAYEGGHKSSPLCTFRRAKLVTIAPRGEQPVLIDIDGESPGRAPMRVEMLPGALTLRG
jgi:diacylglycerol kinase (ATP)